MLKLKSWIDINKLDWRSLSLNPNAIKMLKNVCYEVVLNILYFIVMIYCGNLVVGLRD